MKDQLGFEGCLTSAATEYAYAENDKNFNVIVEVSCNDGKAGATVIDDDVINGYVLSAISTVCHTSQPERFVEHNKIAVRIARLAASLAMKGGPNA